MRRGTKRDRERREKEAQGFFLKKDKRREKKKQKNERSLR